MKESISTLVSMPMVFNKETKAVEGAFGYAFLKMSETALPSTFWIKAIVMVILSPLMDN